MATRRPSSPQSGLCLFLLLRLSADRATLTRATATSALPHISLSQARFVRPHCLSSRRTRSMLSTIPAYQTLGRKSGWRWQSAAELPYPLCHDRVRYYYLGRNAVYHGAEALGLHAGDEVLFPSYHS